MRYRRATTYFIPTHKTVICFIFSNASASILVRDYNNLQRVVTTKYHYGAIERKMGKVEDRKSHRNNGTFFFLITFR